MRIAFDWDPAKAASNVAKHGVTFREAMTVFRDPLAMSLLDDDSSADEERWVTLGLASTGNLCWLCTLGGTPSRTASRCASFRRGGPTVKRRGSIAKAGHEGRL